MHQLARNRIDPIRRDDIVGERIAGESTRIARIGPGRERIVNDDWLPGGILQSGKIAQPPLRQRHREGADIRRPLPKTFVIDEKEGAASANRTAAIAAELFAREAALLDARAIAEEIVRIQRVVAEEAKCRPVKLIRTALGDKVDDTAPEPAELRADGVGLHAELLHGIN